MAKISDAAAKFVRSVFSRDKQKSELAVSSMDLLASARGRSFGSMIDVSGVGGIGEALGLDRRLLYRYGDYEEMDEYGDIASALDIYADDGTQIDSATGHSVWVEAKDKRIKEELEDMFWKRLNIEEHVWPISRTLCKYGNDMEEIVVSDRGVVDLRFMPPATVRRVESNKGDLLGFVQSYSGDIEVSPKEFEEMRLRTGAEIGPGKDVAAYEDWRVSHMRLLSKHRDSLYGWSITEGARWVWKRLILLEDAVMVYKLTRSPSRYAFYVDVGKQPRQEAERSIQEVMQRLKKKKFVNPKTGKLDFKFSPLAMDEDFFLGMRDGKESTRVESLMGPSYQQVEDVQYFLYKLYAALKVPRAYMGYDENQPSKATLCLAGNTPIPLLDGTEPTIAELAKRTDPFWVYSVDKDNNIVPGLARNARLTRRQVRTVEVELDNGEVLTCTPDHPGMMRDGLYREAVELENGDSLMPLYRRESTGSMSGYEEVYDPGSDKWRFTHRMVTDALFEDIENGYVRHHENFNKSDNRPENIEIMEWHDHRKLHAEHAEKTLLRPDVVSKKLVAQRAWLESEEGQRVVRENLVNNRGEGSRFREVMNSEEYRKKHSEQMKRRHADPGDPINDYRKSDRCLENDHKHSGRMSGQGNPKWRDDASFSILVEVAESYRCTGIAQIAKWTGYSTTLIRRLISDEGMTYREFAERFMTPSRHRQDAYRRDYKNHKVVAVRPGPVIDTYDLTVDGYHNFAVGQGVFVHNSQEDVRFARTILRVQREVRNGFKKIARVDLAVRNIDPAAVEFDVMMTVPSSIFELGQMEVRRARADLASLMERHVSLHWMLSNIYNMSDEEIEGIASQKKDEQKMMGGGGGGGFESKDVTALKSLLTENRGRISERELFEGNREDEKRIEDKMLKVMQDPSNPLGRQLRETGMFVREIAHSLKTK